MGYPGEIHTDPSKPGGTPRKLLDVGRIEGMVWKALVGLREGVESAYGWFLAHLVTLRG